MTERIITIHKAAIAFDKYLPESIKKPLLCVKMFAMPHLENGREKYDLPHTFNVDYFAAKIARGEGLDELTLRTSAWLHDTGNSVSRTDHGSHSRKIAEGFFDRYSQYYNPQQMRDVLKIIELHNKPRLITETTSIAFMEADVLGAITTDYDKFNQFKMAAAYAGNTLAVEIGMFQTQTGKALLRDWIPIFLKELYDLP